jgi:DNA repair photolyase
VKIREIEARTILVPSKLPDADYVVNPYTGCEFGCLYCYASFMGRFVGEPVRAWGDYVYVKANAVSLLVGELRRWSPKRRRASPLLLSSVTDPYHGVDRQGSGGWRTRAGCTS